MSGLIPGEFATPANTNLQEKIEAFVHLNDIPEDVIDRLRMKSNYRDLLAIWDIPTANRDLSIIHDLLESFPDDLVLWELSVNPIQLLSIRINVPLGVKHLSLQTSFSSTVVQDPILLPLLLAPYG